MKLTQRLSILAGLSFLLFQGCSSSTTPPPTSSTTVQYSVNNKYTYNQDQLDTTSTTTTKDQRDSTNRDIITSTVTSTSATYGGKTGVVVIVNTHSSGATTDTTMEYQDSGYLYTYNYGLTALNNNPGIIAVLGHKIDGGWVLQSKLAAAAGATWEADSITLPLSYGGLNTTVTVIDMATQQADTTVTVKGKSMVAKHTVHSVSASIFLGSNITIATMPIDTYVTLEEGMVLNVAHSFVISVPTLTTAQIMGQYTQMTSF